MNPTTIPATIAPEAAARVAELGMQRELEQMLDFLRQEVAGVLSVDVQLALPYDTGDETSIVLEVPLDRPWSDASARRQIRDWKIRAFPPQVNRYFAILTVTTPLPGGESLLPKEAMLAAGVSVQITADADQRVAQLGMQRELRLMLEHAIQTIPALQSLEVTLAPSYDTGEEPGINIKASADGNSMKVVRRSRDAWARWKGERFPADVGRYFVLMIH
jgi:hypothetical protein